MNRIITDQKILTGKPVIKGTRISVELVLKLLAEGRDIHYITDQYPPVTKEDILAALDYAHGVVAHEGVQPLRVSFA